MIIKEVVIETDNGDTITMTMDKVQEFFDSIERLKLAADPERRKRQEQTVLDHYTELQRMARLAEIERLRGGQVRSQQEFELRNSVGTLARYKSDPWANYLVPSNYLVPVSDSTMKQDLSE